MNDIEERNHKELQLQLKNGEYGNDEDFLIGKTN